MINQEYLESLGWKRHEDTDRYDNNPYMLIHREGEIHIHRIGGENLFSGKIDSKTEFESILNKQLNK